MSVQSTIESKLQSHFAPQILQVENESHMHSGPATESHFKLTIVADGFTGKKLLARHQEVYRLLQGELDQGVHALALHTYTPQEWQQRSDGSPASPECRGGSKSG